MAFWDWASTVGTRSAYRVQQAWQTLRNYGASKVDEFRRWRTDQRTEYNRLQAQNAAAQQRYDQLRTGYPNMSAEQRANEMGQATWNSPGIFQRMHAHPVGNFLAAPFRLIGRAFQRTGSAAARAAPHVTPGSNTVFIILAIIYHIIFGFLLPSIGILEKIIINIFFMLFVIFVIFDRSERNGDTFRFLFLWVFIGEILIPYLVAEVSLIRNIDFIRLYVANGMILLTWYYYAVFVRGQEVSGGFTTFCKVVTVLFWIFVAVSYIFGVLYQGSWSDVELESASGEQIYAAKKLFGKAWDGVILFRDTILSTIDRVQSTIDMRIKSASGEYYFGVVEENEDEPLGVTLENLKASQTQYTPNDPVTVFATLKARTLDDTVNVQIACYAGKGTTATKGDVYPADSFAVSTLQEEELDCSFARLPEGTQQITYTASFNFETIAYLKRYFADRDAMAAASRQNIDLLDEYQIQDQQPIAHYTNGPVVIGMGPEQVLIGVSPTYAVEPRIGVTIDSGHGWNGKIKELQQLILILPKELSLDTAQCTDPHWSTYSVSDCITDEQRYNSKIAQECSGNAQCLDDACTALLADYHAYSLDVSGSTYKNIEDYVTITCRMKVDDIQSLLGATPIATHYFYAKTRYTYEVSDDTSVVIEEEEDTYQPEGEDATTKWDSSNIPSFTFDQKEKELQFIFYNYQEQLFTTQQQYGVPVCTQAGIIAVISSGDPQYYEDGRKGLMGITDQLATALGTDPAAVNMYDVTTNINLGNKYLDQINDTTQDNIGTETLKAYYSMLYVQNPLAAPVSSDSATQFASHVSDYITECTNLGLENTQLLENEKAPTVFASYIPYSALGAVPPIFLYTDKNGNLLELQFNSNSIPGTTGSVDLLHGGGTIDSISTYASRADRWFGFTQYGLVQIMFNESNASDKRVEYRFFNDFVTTVQLTEDKKIALVDGALYARYTGSDIEIFTTEELDDPDAEKEVCDAVWDEYMAYTTCDEAKYTDNDDDMLAGLIVRNIKTDVDTFGVGYANVQIEWSNQKQLEAIK